MNDCWVEVTFDDGGKEVYYLLNEALYFNQGPVDMYEFGTLSEVKSMSKSIKELVLKEK